MRNDLRAALLRGDKDDAILRSLVQKYGATLVASSDETRLAGIVVFIVLAVMVFLIALVRKRRSHLAAVTTPVSNLPDIELDALRYRVQEQAENDEESKNRH
jgi:hypothetical protein